MRDNQRQKVYNAEREALDRVAKTREPRFHWDKPEKDGMVHYTSPVSATWKTVEEAQAYADKVLSRAYVIRNYGQHYVRIDPGRGNRRATAWGSGTRPSYPAEIKLPRWARKEWVVLHELSHVLAPDAVHHGDKFAAIFLDLVRHMLGKDAHAALKAAFKKHKVRYTPKVKRQVSPERRAQLQANMAKVRAAKGS